MVSAEASLEPDFPLAPVYFVSTGPWPKKLELFFSNTSAKVGSYAAFTSEERQNEFL